MTIDKTKSEYWKLEKGFFAFYTEDKATIRSIKRYYSDRFLIMAEYTKNDKLIGIQYKFSENEIRRVIRYIEKRLGRAA